MSPYASHHSLRVALLFTFSLLVVAQHKALPRAAAATQSPDDGALRLLAGEFFVRYARKDLDAFMSLWSAGSPERAVRRQAAEKFFATHGRVELQSLNVIDVAEKGEKAAVRVAVQIVAGDMKTGEPAVPGGTRRVLEFVREDGGWKVWRELSAAEELAERLVGAGEGAGRDELLTRNAELLTPELSEVLRKQGRVFQNSYEYPRALSIYQLAHHIAEQAGDRRVAAVTAIEVANVRRLLGDYTGTLNSLHKSLEAAEALNHREIKAAALTSIGSLYYSQGAYAQALEYHQRALAVRESLGSKDPIGSSLLNIGLIYQQQGDYAAAADYFRRSLEIRESVGNKYGIANALSLLGDVSRSQGDYKTALELQHRALLIREELDKDNDKKLNVAISYGHLGLTYLDSGDYARAAENFRKRLKLWEKIEEKRGLIDSLNDLGRVSYLQKDYAEALRLVELSAALARQVGARQPLAWARAIAAKSHRALNQLNESRRALEEAIETVESLRANISGQESRATYLAAVREPYELYIDLLMQMHKERPSEGHDRSALEMSERARARSLLEALAETWVDVRQGVDHALVQRERTLLQQLNARAEQQTRLLSGKHSAEQAAALEKEIAGLAATYREVQAQIRRASPRYASLTQPQPLTLTQVQRQVLDRDTALLQYALGEERSYLWAVTPDSLMSFELPKRAQLEAVTRRLRDLLADAGRWATSETAEAEYESAARELGRMLLPDGLLARLGAKRLVIVPDGALQYVPFGALPVPGPGDGAAQRNGVTKYLIADHEVVNLPSASTLAVLRGETKGQARAPKMVAVFADPVFDARDERVATAAKRREGSGERPPGNTLAALSNLRAGGERGQEAGRPKASAPPKLSPELTRAALASGVLREGARGLTRLPFSRREAQTILALAPAGQARGAFDFEASRRVATGGELAGYRFVHFATHALLNNEHPELSGVVLSLIDERGQAVDGFLRLNEIYNLRLPAELVVLSACQTALGREVRGEGVVGLVRGFMYAGSPRVVASLWKVDDRSTAELMRRFYEGLLKRGLRPAAALRAAKLGMLKEGRWRAPFHWAAFELQGEWR